MHLRLIYHRLIAAGRLNIDIEVYDRTIREAGAPERVVPIDPFGFSASAVSGYPKSLVAHADQTELRLECHIVPPKSSGPSFRLYGRDGADFQGFYIYRNDRLLQVGGWNQVTTNHRNRALARVVIDDFTSLSPHVRMAPEKSGINLSPDLVAAIAGAKAEDGGGDAVSFEAYLSRAESVLAESKRRRRVRHPVAEPSKGLHEDIRIAIRSEAPVRENEGPVEVRWRRLPPDKFIDLNREDRVIYLNQRYRDMLTGGKTGLSDAPLLKTLVFLLTEEHFKGQYWGSRDKDLLEMWESLLGTAVQTEYAYRMNERPG